jgi:TM2 domain-containing membrane protein YozV
MSSRDHDRGEWFELLQRRTTESDKDLSVAVGLSVTLGWLGVDRFYLGYSVLGVLKLLTFGGFLVWWIIDIVLLLTGTMKDGEGRALRSRSAP